MAYHVENLSAEIDVVENDDGTWRAEKYPPGTHVSSARDDYPSRASLMRDLCARPHSFWEGRP